MQLITNNTTNNTDNTDNEKSSQPTVHEHLMQRLSTMLLQLNSLQTLLPNRLEGDTAGQYTFTIQQAELDALRNGLTTIEEIAREAIYEIRSANCDWSAISWAAMDLVGVTLVEALSRAVEETAESMGLSSRVTFNGEERALPGYTERLLYRVAQEVLYQVQQHSNARKLRFVLSFGRDEVQMSIEDDGTLPSVDEQMVHPRAALAGTPTVYEGEEVPIPHFQNARSEATREEQVPLPHFKDEGRNELGTTYRALRQRIEHLGGLLEVSRQAVQGTRVVVRVPYTRAGDAGDHKGPPTTSSPLPPLRYDGAGIGDVQASVGTKVRLLVVDDQAVSRAGLRRVLESYPDLQVIGEAADGVQAVSETLELGPQVVLMDAHLPNGQSMEALKQIKQLNLDTRVLLFSAQDREEYLYETLRAGADGYVLKDIVPDELAQAVRVVASGEVLVQPQLAGRLLSRFGRQGRGNAPYETLTAREREVLHLLARGLRNKEIAARLVVSERTVNFHLANIYQKLNVSGRTEALSKALEHGLITA